MLTKPICHILDILESSFAKSKKRADLDTVVFDHAPIPVVFKILLSGHTNLFSDIGYDFIGYILMV